MSAPATVSRPQEGGNLRPAAEGEQLHTDEDASLWEAFRAGDGSAFDRLYRRLGPAVLRWMSRAFQVQHADAANLTQHVFLCLFARREEIGYDAGRARFRTWFWNFARCRAIDELRKRRRSTESALDNLGVEQALAERAAALAVEHEEQEESRARLLLCLEAHDCLDDKEKFVIRNSNTEGLGEMTQAEVAEALQRSPGQISKIKQSAIRKLTLCMNRART
jgi:RNA polymerase sigma factor (sigma-70 family)